MNPLLLKRLSNNFTLLDFMYGYENYTNMYVTNLALASVGADTIERGERFCREFLDPLIVDYGPCSVANGLRFGCKGPHQWNRADGVAADVVFHDWVNQDLAPVRLLGELDQNGYEFERIISYAGTEFSCLAWRPEGLNRAAFYENVRKPGQPKPLFITHGRVPSDRANRIGKPVPARRDWRREPLETVYHTQRQLRAQHIRVGRYFTLLDMCRNATAFHAGVLTVPPARYFTSHRVNVARMFAEVLEPVVAKHGQVSIIRGMEPASPRLERDPLYRWTEDAAGGQAALTIAVPHGYECVAAELLEDGRVAAVDEWVDSESVYFEIVIDQFDVTTIWTSAK